MIFARKADDNLASLVKQLDKALAKNKDKKLSSFVNIIGEDREALEATAKKFSAKNKVENVAIAVPVEFENGPGNFGINPKAEVTVMLYSKTKVAANHAFAPGKLNAAGIKAVLADLEKILN